MRLSQLKLIVEKIHLLQNLEAMVPNLNKKEYTNLFYDMATDAMGSTETEEGKAIIHPDVLDKLIDISQNYVLRVGVMAKFKIMEEMKDRSM